MFIVPEGHWAVMEFCGKFDEVLEPGLHTYVPFIATTKNLSAWGNIANKHGYLIEKSEQHTNTPTRHCQTKDNVTISANTSIGWRVIDPKKAVYAVDTLPSAISDLALNSLRSKVGSLTFEQVFSSKQVLNEKIKEDLAETIAKWGIELFRVEIQELTYSKEVEQAMMKQMIAEKERRAMIYIADGESESTLMKARANAETKLIEAQSNAEIMKISAEAEAAALLLAAEARAKALEVQSSSETQYLQALKTEVNTEQAATILNSEKKLKSLEKITENPSHKVFLDPNVETKIMATP